MEKQSDTCILCSNADQKKVVDSFRVNDLKHIYKKRFPDYDFEREFANHTGDVKVLSCSHCDLLYFSPQIAGSDRFYEYLQKFDWYYSVNKPEFDFAKRHIGKNDHVLEIGSGSGFFAKNLECGSYIGLEFNDESIKNAALNGVTLLKEPIEQHAQHKRNTYDVVCAFQVLEHISNPGSFVKASIEALKPGGKLIFAIPSADSYAAYFPNHHLNLPPHHITLWTDKNFERMADVFGLELKHIYHETCDRRQMEIYLHALVVQAFNKKFNVANNNMVEVSFWSRVKQYVSYRIALFLAAGISNEEAFNARGQSVTVVYEKR
jgi:SAM-dependent methyltransferase